MDGISGNNPVGSRQDIPLQPTDVDVKEELAEIAPLFSDEPSLQVSAGGRTGRADGPGRGHDLRDLPEIDDADEALLAIEADLEALIALLTAEQDEKTLAVTKKRIESLKGQIEQHHTYTRDKITTSLKEMQKQETASKVNRILGWIGAVVGVVVAVALIATGGGLAAGLALFGAVAGVVLQSLNEAGVMDDFAKAISDSLAKTAPGLSKEARDALAQGVVALVSMAVTLPFSLAGGLVKTASMAATTALQIARLASTISGSFFSVTGLVTSGVCAGFNYTAQGKQAEVTETQKLLLELQTMLEQEQADLEEILKKLQDAFGAVIELLQSKQDALNEINLNIGA